MERTYINEVQKEIGSTVKVQGFIENLRNSKYMAFIVLKDITGKLQITVEKEDHPELVDTIDKLTPDSVITVTGKVMENDYVKMGGIEMIPEAIEIESIANALPIVRKEIAATKKKKAVERSSIDQRIDYRWIDLRTDENQLMFKAQSCFVNAMRKFLLDRNFIEIHTPKLIAAASESGSEVFKVDYFDRNAYLAQSPQFYKQMAMAAGFERIFETGPVFRAEKSYTNKHSTEFSGFDLEFSYITSYKDVMKMEEELLTAGLKAVKEQYGEQIKELFGLEVVVPTTPFPVVKLADLYKALEEEFGYTVDESEKGDLTTEAERLSYDWVKKHYGHEFLFITDYSAEKRAFYHMRDENGVPQGYDLIWRGVEITTGAQREHRYDVLKKQAEEKGLADDVKFYLEFFQYGCPPHGGFGLRAENAVHKRDFGNGRVVLGDPVQLDLHDHHAGAGGSPAQRGAGVEGGDAPDGGVVHNLHIAIVTAQNPDGVVPLPRQILAAPLAQALAGDGGAVAEFGSQRLHKAGTAKIVVEQLIHQPGDVGKVAAPVDEKLVVGGGVGDIKAVPPAAVKLRVHPVQGEGDDGEDVGTQSGLLPGGVNFAGRYVFHIVRKIYGDVGGVG